MTEAPSNWRYTHLGDHLREPIRNGHSPRCPTEPTGRWILSLAAVTPNGFNAEGIKPAPINDPRVDRALLSLGDIIVSRSNTRERVGLAGIYRGQPDVCAYPDLLMRVRPSNDLDTDFLGHILLSQMGREYFRRSARGTSGSMVKINRTILEKFPLLLPPLPEQRKIAAILSSVDATIEKTEAVIEQLQVVKKAMMQELLTRGLPGRYTRFKKTALGEVPSAWKICRLGDVAERIRAPVEVMSTDIYQEIGIRSHAKGLFYKEPVLGLNLGKKKVFWVQPNCLVLNIVFAWEAAVATTSAREVGMIASHRFPMFRPDPEMLCVEFLRLLMQSPAAVRYLGVISPGGAGRNKTLNQGALLNMEIPVPPLEDQNVISSVICSLEARIELEKALRARQQDLKGELMTVLLTGEVRVTPDDDVQ